VIEIRDGVEGKTCGKCGQWKPLGKFSPDSSKPASQGHTHCRCRECKAEVQRERYASNKRLRLKLQSFLASQSETSAIEVAKILAGG